MTNSSTRIPSSLEDITPGWLNEQVFTDHRDNPITDLNHTAIGDERGFLSQTIRIETERPNRSTHLPESFVVKLRPDNEKSREVEADLNGFTREIRFYSDIADNTDTRLAKVFFAEADADGAALVMEDLSHLKGGDQLVGLSHDQVCGVIETVAPVHAAFWNNPKLQDFDWAPAVDHYHLDSFAGAWPDFEANYGLRIGPDGRQIGQAIADNIDRIEAMVASRPQSIVHGDLRADNILFGEGDHAGDVVVLDWQLTMRNMPTLDLARLYGGSEPIRERASRHREIVELWHDALMHAGVEDYTADDAWADFRLAVLHSISIPVKVHALFSKQPFKRGAQLRDAMAERFFELAVEVDALELLE